MSDLQVRAVVRARDVDISLEVASGETLAVLGPNGAGKSTLLAVLAGLLRPDTGTVRLGERDLAGVPPHARGIALLAQDPLLFPHLSVLENVAFAPRSRGVRRRDAHEQARRHLASVGVDGLAARRPAQISGGQAQRVAVARALAAKPQLLLLDEPMAALDVDVRPALRHTLRTALAEQTTIIVTHDPLDALLLADHVAVVEEGRVVEHGPTQQVLTTPRSAFAARLAGLDLLAGTWDGEHLVTADDLRITGLPDDPLELGTPAAALFRPSAVSVFAEPPGGSPRNHLRTTVTGLEPLGDRIRVRAELHDGTPIAADVTPAAVAELGLALGQQVTYAIKATEVRIYPISGSFHGSFHSVGSPTPGPEASDGR